MALKKTLTIAGSDTSGGAGIASRFKSISRAWHIWHGGINGYRYDGP